MALCDHLEARLDQSTATRRRMLDALLDATLRAADKREVAAA